MSVVCVCVGWFARVCRCVNMGVFCCVIVGLRAAFDHREACRPAGEGHVWSETGALFSLPVEVTVVAIGVAWSYFVARNGARFRTRAVAGTITCALR